MYLAMGGIYFSGGVINGIAECFERYEDWFWNSYLTHHFMGVWLKQIPVYVQKKYMTLDGMEKMIV